MKNLNIRKLAYALLLLPVLLSENAAASDLNRFQRLCGRLAPQAGQTGLWSNGVRITAFGVCQGIGSCGNIDSACRRAIDRALSGGVGYGLATTTAGNGERRDPAATPAPRNPN